jgi:CubicO group peptidase (beta-lactamase class C family)
MTPNPLIEPSRQGLGVGFPPPDAQRVTVANSHLPQHLGWRILNSNRLFPMARISRGEGPIVPLPRGPALDVAALPVDDGQGQAVPMTELWQRTGADATLVLHRGQVVFETYLGDMSATRQHPMFSCTKSVVGLLVEGLIHAGTLDPAAPASAYVPELAPSPVGSATVRQLLDMQANFMFSDRPKVAGEVQVDYIMGLGFIPRPPGYGGPNGVYELLTQARPMGEHGGPFRYDNGSTDALGWILRRLEQRSLDQLISERLWSGLGAEQDGSMMIDASGTEWAAAGMGACLRDFARLGEMLRCRGSFNGRQLVPEAVFDRILQGGDRAAFAGGDGVPAGGSYRSQFWFYHDRHDSHACRGQYGQRLWIAPAAEVVIAQFSIDPHLAALEPLRLRGFQAVADALR